MRSLYAKGENVMCFELEVTKGNRQVPKYILS